jgi:serine/threonine-protein kinase RsbW
MSYYHKSLTVANETSCLREVREFVGEAIKAGEFPPKYTNRLQIAVEEAVTNIIEHGYSGFAPGAGTIEIDVSIDAKSFRVAVKDEGTSFNPKEFGEVDIRRHFNAGKAGGLGVFLMRRIVDKLEYKFENGKPNQLILEKYR